MVKRVVGMKTWKPQALWENIMSKDNLEQCWNASGISRWKVPSQRVCRYLRDGGPLRERTVMGTLSHSIMATVKAYKTMR